MIWNESIECMERDNLHKIQSIRLKKIVEYVYHNTPFYRKKMQELGITPDDINGIEDISKLPFTTKLDLRDNYPFGLCAVPMSQIVRIHASSGTTGKPTVVGYTRKDLSTWAECLSRAFTAYGAGALLARVRREQADENHVRRAQHVELRIRQAEVNLADFHDDLRDERRPLGNGVAQIRVLQLHVIEQPAERSLGRLPHSGTS